MSSLQADLDALERSDPAVAEAARHVDEVSADIHAGSPQVVKEAAEWWAENHGRYWKTRSLLLAHVASEGPVRLDDGRLVGYMPDGNAWDGEGIATVMPDLIRNAEITFTGPKEKVERLLSLALEELPDLPYEVKLAVDAVAANAVIRAGGDAASRLLPYRVAKNKLGVR